MEMNQQAAFRGHQVQGDRKKLYNYLALNQSVFSFNTTSYATSVILGTDAVVKSCKKNIKIYHIALDPPCN